VSNIDKFDLISGADINYQGICFLHPPRLNEIRKIGFNEYNSYIALIMMDLNKCASIIGVDLDTIKSIPGLQVFDIFISNDKLREDFRKVLSFFISGDIEYSISYKAFKVTYNDIVGYINKNNYPDIVACILKLNCINNEQKDETIFKDEASKKLYEKIQNAKKTGKLKSENENFSLTNIISSVALYGDGYNIVNVWELTIYQLYDQFYRLSSKLQLDILGTRWAVWGKEDFDFDFWHKDIQLLM